MPGRPLWQGLHWKNGVEMYQSEDGHEIATIVIYPSFFSKQYLWLVCYGDRLKYGIADSAVAAFRTARKKLEKFGWREQLPYFGENLYYEKDGCECCNEVMERKMGNR